MLDLTNCSCTLKPKKSWYLDVDNDEYAAETKEHYESPGAGWVEGTPKGMDCDDDDKDVHTNNSCGECKAEPTSGKCPCFGAGSTDIDTGKFMDALQENLGDVLTIDLSNKFIDFFDKFSGTLKQGDQFFDLSTVGSGGQKLLSGGAKLGKGLGLLNLGVGLNKYVEDPSTQNLLRLTFDSFVTFAAPVVLTPVGSAGLTVSLSLVELYKLDNGDTIIDRAFRIIGKELDDLIDCDLGAGILGSTPDF